MIRGLGYSSERDGGRWPAAGLAAALVMVAAIAVGAFAPGGTGSRLTVEGLSALALVLAVTAGVWWQRARHDQPDVELAGGYARGRRAELVGLARSWPNVPTEALAEIRLHGQVYARLHRWDGDADDLEVIAAELLDPSVDDTTPHTKSGPVTRRGRRRRDHPHDHDPRPGLRLEHRRGDLSDLDPPVEGRGAEVAGTPEDLGAPPGQEVPAVVVRLVDDRGHPVGGAHAYRHGDLDDWVIPADPQTLRLRVQRTHELTYRHRPTRRTFIDTTTTTSAYLARTRRRPKRWEFTAPTDLEPDTVLLCLWLVHLLDIHTLLGQAWEPPGPSWTPVTDEFPHWVGPGGFGDSRPTTNSGGYGGGGTGGN